MLHEHSEAASTVDGRLIAERFRLLEPLGRGGMGRVYRAHDELLDRPVAVKLIYDDAIADGDVRHACALEARAAARLNHPGIVRILDSGFDDGHLYVVMSLAEGETLAELLRRDGPLPPERALAIAAQVADALGAAHREGIVHCDVKPSNLIVRPDGRVQLVDFGIARIAASTTSLDASTRQGSAEYVAPEQVEGAAVDARTDLYALGIVLFEMLTGHTPFGGGTLAVVLARRLVADAPSVRVSHPELPVSVECVVQRMAARDPSDRFQSADTLLTAIRAVRDELRAETEPTPAIGGLTATMPFPLPGVERPEADRAWMRQTRDALADRTVQAAVAGRHAATVAWADVRFAGLRMARAGEQEGRAVLRRLWPLAAWLWSRLAASARRTSLVGGIGMAMAAAFLVAVVALWWVAMGASAEPARAASLATIEPAPSAAPPTAIPATGAPAPPTAVPTSTASAPMPTAVEPTATLPAPTSQAPQPSQAAPEGPAEAVTPPAGPVAAPPARVLAVPAPQPEPPAAKPAPTKADEKTPDEKKSDEKKPDEKKPDEKKPAAHGAQKQDAKPAPGNGRGNGNGGGQKKR